ncbi:MAG: PQQ-binding-like beta-propeller repeat protein [Rhodopirellula sp.]|nr:PQQ-binding-like beta-propeller repeat protein [Rhodopirellula sp.]
MKTMNRFLTTATACLAITMAAHAEDWPQYQGPRRDGVWRETGIVETLPATAEYRWRTPIGAGFAGPAVADGRVYLCDRMEPTGDQLSEYRWDKKDPVQGLERILCLDADTGAVVWKHEYPCRYTISYPSGPRATPTVCEGRVYCLGAMGDLLCLDAQTGRVVWSKNYVRDYGTEINPWGMAAAPLVDCERLIALVGGKQGAGVVAWNKETGVELWRALDCPDPGYSAPVMAQCGSRRQLLVWCPIGLYSLQPDSGNVFWHESADLKMGHSIASPVFDPDRRLVFATSFFNGPLMMQLDPEMSTARLLWKGESDIELPGRTQGLHGLMATPAFHGGYLYGVCSYGQLRCLEPQTGRRVWETFAATGEGRWATAFLVKHEDRFLLFNEHGELILARLSPKGYEEIGRMAVLEPTMKAGRRMVVWSPPAFAHRALFARNDKEIVCVDLAAPRPGKAE